MIIAEKAILHILAATEPEPMLSAQELELDGNVQEFLLKHLEKSISSQDAKTGKFYENSEFDKLLQRYEKEELDFIGFSQEIARMMFQIIRQDEASPAADLIVCAMRADDVPQLALLKCVCSQGYVHQVSVDEQGSLAISIADSTGLLPGGGQRIEEFAFINLESREVLFKAKKHSLDGNNVFALPELVLECEQKPSPREAIKQIRKVAQQVAEAYCQDQTATAAAVKASIAETLQDEGAIDAQKIGETVFRESPAMQEDFQQEIISAGLQEPVKANKEATLKKMQKHRLVTDTGIDISIPTEFFENTEYVEFYRDESGNMSITLKNIHNITNK